MMPVQRPRGSISLPGFVPMAVPGFTPTRRLAHGALAAAATGNDAAYSTLWRRGKQRGAEAADSGRRCSWLLVRKGADGVAKGKRGERNRGLWKGSPRDAWVDMLMGDVLTRRGGDQPPGVSFVRYPAGPMFLTSPTAVS